MTVGINRLRMAGGGVGNDLRSYEARVMILCEQSRFNVGLLTQTAVVQGGWALGNGFALELFSCGIIFKQCSVSPLFLRATKNKNVIRKSNPHRVILDRNRINTRPTMLHEATRPIDVNRID